MVISIQRKTATAAMSVQSLPLAGLLSFIAAPVRSSAFAPAFLQVSECIDSTIAEEWPVRTSGVDEAEITFDVQGRFSFVVGLCENISVGVSHKAASPELNLAFGTDTIGSSHKQSIGDGVTAHHGLPCGVLAGAVDVSFARDPADGCGVEEHFGTLHCGQSCGFWVPLIPADADADSSVASWEGEEPEIAWCEVEFFEIQRVIGDMHFSVQSGDAAVGIQDHGRVVVQAVCASFEEWHDDDDLKFFGDFLQGCGCGAWNWFSESEAIVFFGLAGVLSVEDFLQADDLCTGCCCIANSVDGSLQIDVRFGHAGHLAESSTDLWLGSHGSVSGDLRSEAGLSDILQS